MQKSSVAEIASSELDGRFHGEVIGPDHSSYDEARAVFNAMIDRRPGLIARCTGADDVVAALAFARRHELAVAVRGGGHSAAGQGVCDDGVLIDLVGMRQVEVDPQARRAVAGGGVLWGEFDAATQEHGLVAPGGRVTTTGVGGFTLGGGYAWISSKYGLALDALRSAEVVTADGQVLTASEDENPDLFWGIRGGGGNFGVVTRFEFELERLGPLVYAGLSLWPVERAAEVLRGWRDYVDGAPDELSTAAVIITAPPEDFVPDHLKGQLAVGLGGCYVGDVEAGAEAFAPLKALEPEVDLIQPMPYTAFQAILDPSAPAGQRNYWRGEYMTELSDAAIDTFIENAPKPLVPPFSQMLFFRMGGAVSAVADDATAFSHRDAEYLFHPIAVWQDPAMDEQVIGASRAFCDAMRPFTTGAAYLNFTTDADRVRSAFGEEKYARLVELKDRYDPDNIFRLNQNIQPSRA